jgi:hypothetical protein
MLVLVLGVNMIILVILIRLNLVIYPIVCYRCHTGCNIFNFSSEILWVVAEGWYLFDEIHSLTFITCNNLNMCTWLYWSKCLFWRIKEPLNRCYWQVLLVITFEPVYMPEYITLRAYTKEQVIYVHRRLKASAIPYL